jgi:hypothetical protein
VAILEAILPFNAIFNPTDATLALLEALFGHHRWKHSGLILMPFIPATLNAFSSSHIRSHCPFFPWAVPEELN